MNRTDRLLAIVLELQAKGWQRAEDLATTFEVSKRSIYRDLGALSESGVPVISQPGRGYALDPGYFLPPLSFTRDEALILLLGADFMAQNFDAQYQRAAQIASTKITAALSDSLREEVTYLKENVRFVTSVSPLRNADKVQKIRRAILNCQTIQFVYHTRHVSSTEIAVKARLGNPHSLISYANRWYMWAYCHLRKEIRVFRLDRMESVELTPHFFKRQPDFVILDAHDTRPLVIKALFHPSIVRWVREDGSYFAVSEEERPDGLLITLKARSEEDVIIWLMQWGGSVRVLAPDSIRERLLREAETMVKQYKSSD